MSRYIPLLACLSLLIGVTSVSASDCSTGKCHGGLRHKKFVHAALDEGCEACHEPTGSTHPAKGEKGFRLSGAEKEVCLSCHSETVSESAKFIHTPVALGRCTGCHDPHGSDYPYLLKKEYPVRNYVRYSKKEYQLCFSCHKRDLLMFPDTSFATKFRDGEKNLHYFHVKKPRKGKNCRMCHVMHASGRPGLIADSAVFGRWRMPIGFEPSPSGGTCSPGCHETRTYDRNRRQPGSAAAPKNPFLSDKPVAGNATKEKRK